MIHKRFWHSAGLLALLLMVSGCASNVVIDHDSAAIFGNYGSWAFAPRQESGFLSLDAGRAEAAIERELNRKSMGKLDPDEADLLVSYRVEDVERLDTTGFSYGLGFGRRNFAWGLSVPPPVREITEGKLVVELVDRESGRVVWRGASQRYLNENQTPERRRQLIDEVVQEMFSKYPPG